MNEFRNRIAKAAECITNEMFASTWRETEYRLDVRRVTNGAHAEICRAHQKFREVQCLKIYQFHHIILG